MTALDDSVKKLNEQLKRISGISGPQGKKALLKGSEVLRREAQLLAPVLTGALKANSESVIVDDGVEMRFNQEYAVYQEIGTAKMSGHPYVRPAIDENENKIVEAVKDELQKGIKEAVDGD